MAVKAFSIELESEGAAKTPLTYTFKNSHQKLRLVDGLSKKPLTAALIKVKQRGMLVYDAREVCCCRQREIRS